MFECAKNSLWFDVKERAFGQQDRGVSPSGASDQLSFFTAKVLLGNPKSYRCAEIIFTSSITFTEEVLFTLTGAHYKQTVLNRKGRETQLEQAAVYEARIGDTLTLQSRQKGFRLYLFVTPLNSANSRRICLKRGPFSRWFTPPPRKIRLFEGVEKDFLEEEKTFLNQIWKISNESNRMGIKLLGDPMPSSAYDIVSSAVDDGTIQLTSSGPVVLLRERQTTGGYPRIFQIANIDIDFLAQYPAGTNIEFELIGMERAKELLAQRCEQMVKFKEAFLYRCL